jgi:hypothetical protein
MLIALLTGVLSAVISTFIAALPTLGSVIAPSAAPPQIRASSFFPAPAAVHKVVNVYDPVPVAAQRPPESQPPSERDHPNPSPSPEPHGSPNPTPSPTPGDD